MNTGHVSPASLAERLNVTPEAVYRWLRNGMLFGEKRGKEWQIPIDDALLFVRSYAKKTGTPLSPIPPHNQRRSYAVYSVTGASRPQTMTLTLSPEAVRHLDEVRRGSCEKLSRSAVIERAILEYGREQ